MIHKHVKQLQLTTTPNPDQQIIGATGHYETDISTATIGTDETLCPSSQSNFRDTLIGTSPILDNGYEITLSKLYAAIINPNPWHIVRSYQRCKDGLYRLPVEDLYLFPPLEDSTIDIINTYAQSPSQQSTSSNISTIENIELTSKFISTMLLSQMWLRKDQRGTAARHWSFVHNPFPNYRSNLSPHFRMTGENVDARHQYKFAFGDLVIHSISKEMRVWKCDPRNDIGVYVGDQPGMKDAGYVYHLHTHDIKPRGALQKIHVSDYQLLHWFSHLKTNHHSNG